jgi:proteasome accessory factor B
VSRRGRWYVAGHDRDRGQVRVFRLSRILGAVTADGAVGTVVVPDDADVREIVDSSASPAPDRRTATVRLRRGAAHGIRRWAADVRPDAGEWDVAELGFADVDRLVDYLAGFADDIVVVGPPDVRDAMIQHLKAVLA